MSPRKTDVVILMHAAQILIQIIAESVVELAFKSHPFDIDCTPSPPVTIVQQRTNCLSHRDCIAGDA